MIYSLLKKKKTVKRQLFPEDKAQNNKKKNENANCSKWSVCNVYVPKSSVATPSDLKHSIPEGGPWGL